MKKALAFCLCVSFFGAGCAPATAPQAPSPSQTPTPTTQPSTKKLDENDNKTTVSANVGDRVELVLNSTYWQVAPPSSDVLKQVADPVVVPILIGHVPGSGAGTVTVDYQVTKTGTAQISASRTSCGEALRCTGDQGSYSVTINSVGTTN
ncbi:MAG: hypothetical protein WA001_04540 [Patescibacteria group bacterium]